MMIGLSEIATKLGPRQSRRILDPAASLRTSIQVKSWCALFRTQKFFQKE